eukprot:GHVT01011921.1.p1 GENE.GHVT01011921.1~~GHVT01011921.1.p1  ORF type:complete len:588 (-),score=127.38 GHVT01011921.1:619-2382(-)
MARDMTAGQLYNLTARMAAALKEAGVQPGSRVAGVVANTPETLAAMLATNAIGGVWSSCSPDFGVDALVDRFGQISPLVLFAADFYIYKGKTIDCRRRALEAFDKLPSAKKLIFLPFEGTREGEALACDAQPFYSSSCSSDSPFSASPTASINGKEACELSQFIEGSSKVLPSLAFHRTSFNAPAFILFSSGTTNAPKCIVHRAGALLQLMKEHQLHIDIKPGDAIFYYTTCGWMMWHWLVAGLASGARLLLYEGNPVAPDAQVLWNWAQKTRCSLFGTSAKYLELLRKQGARPIDSHELSALKTICSTGSPLSHETFGYVYSSIKRDVHLVSMSGGTDILSCFALGNPTGGVWQGELQAKGLGMAVDVFDESGRSVRMKKGELVCTKPFPSQPCGFWNDPDDTKYKSSYFSKFGFVWNHGDWVESTAHGGLVIHGRSDTVLNAAGVRIGTGEIYRQVENLEEVSEAVAVGWEVEDDIEIVLCLKLQSGFKMSKELVGRIKTTIREGATARHVPQHVFAVDEIPKTKTGKLAEIAVRDVINGKPVKNLASLVNPSCLQEYQAIRNKIERSQQQKQMNIDHNNPRAKL